MQKLISLLLLHLTLIGHASAQDAGTTTKLEDLTVAEYKALERVTESSVTGTISFLASDELAGRGTPSKEFTIATAYVASRFRAAGAKGLGQDGSYFVESIVDTVQTPDSGSTLQIADGTAPAFTLFNPAAAPFAFEGQIPLVAKDGSLPNDKAGPAVMIWDDSADAGPKAASLLRRRAVALADKKVTALLVVTSPQGELWKMASQWQRGSRLDEERGRIEIPILLVAKKTWTDDSVCNLKLPAVLTAKASVRNVVAVIEGSDPELSQEAVFYSAHLDHLGGNGTGEDKIFNGADDDASGVTAVLTLADAYGALEPRAKRSVVFMTFWGEEHGMLGSKKLIENSPWPLNKLVAGINIEMVGRPEEGARNKTWMTGWTESDLGPLVAMGARRVGVENFEHPSLSKRLYAASDNISFVNKGVIAHSFSAGSLHGDYHQPTDEWQRLDLPHMTQVIRGLYAGTLPIAQGIMTPVKKNK
jgi:Peptidase family M28